MSAWSRGETLKDRCNRLLREVILGEYRPPGPFDYLDDEFMAAEQVYVWLHSIGITGGSTQAEHVRHYMTDITTLRETIAAVPSTSGGEK